MLLITYTISYSSICLFVSKIWRLLCIWGDTDEFRKKGLHDSTCRLCGIRMLVMRNAISGHY